MSLKLHFSNDASGANAYRLLELTPDLTKLIESGDSDLQLSIKGRVNDDAVLCTADKTYILRAVTLSNTVLVVGADKDGSDERVEIRDEVSQILELVPSMPNLHRMDGLLRGSEYDEGHEQDEDDDLYVDDDELRPMKRRKFTHSEMQREIQASDQELDRGLREHRILEIDGYLRPITPSYLTKVLELLLNTLVSTSQPPDDADTRVLIESLQDDHDIREEVSLQVMRWFGDVIGGKWSVDQDAVVQQVGLGILRTYQHEPLKQTDFLAKWREAVGDTFADSVNLSLLRGNHLIYSDPDPIISYFPSKDLPLDPTERFADLFLTRSRWRADDIEPFLADIAVDKKARDKLLLKYARTATDKEGTRYTARVLHA